MSLKESRNPKLYRELSAPLESSAVAMSALEGFYADLSEIRKKHHIPDLYVVMTVNWLNADGEQETSLLTSMWGDQAKAVTLVAYAYGLETAAHEAHVSETIKKGKQR